MALPPTTPNSIARRINFGEPDNTQQNNLSSNNAWDNSDLLTEDTTYPNAVGSLASRFSQFQPSTTRRFAFGDIAPINWISLKEKDETSQDLEKRLSPPSKKTKSAEDTPKANMAAKFSETHISPPSITFIALSALSTPSQTESMEFDGYSDSWGLQENDPQITKYPPKVKKAVPPTPRKREYKDSLEQFSEVSSPFLSFNEGMGSRSTQQQNTPSAPEKSRKGWSRRFLEPVQMEFSPTGKVVAEEKIPTEVVIEEKPKLTPEEQAKADWEALIPIRRIKIEYVPKPNSRDFLTKLVWGKSKDQSASINYLNKGDFQEVWRIQDQPGQHLVIKTFLSERKDFSCVAELGTLLLAYEQIYGGVIPGFSINGSGEAIIEGVRLAKWLNRETAKEEGVSIYEFVEGKRATYKDVLPYLKAVASDPERYLLMDFMPWNVIVPEAKEPVLVDLRARGPEWDNVNWDEIKDSVEWKTADNAWKNRIYHMTNLFAKWLKDKKPWVSEAVILEFQTAFENIKFKSPEVEVFFKHILSLVTT
jgi:hypothetical protein